MLSNRNNSKRAYNSNKNRSNKEAIFRLKELNHLLNKLQSIRHSNYQIEDLIF